MKGNHSPIRVLSVDDHALLRVGIATLLSSESDIELVAEASNGYEAIDQFRLHRPDVTLMDLQMPVLTGIEAVIDICAEFPNARIIVLTTFDGDVQALRALQAGARGYLLKRQVYRELPDAIRAVHAGKKRIPPDIAVALVDHMTDEGLTQREIDVLRLIADGNSNKEIATHLSLSEETIKNHVTNILSKLGVNNRSHAVTIGLKRGILEL
jgi:DNA-binding NarL/FixJ family response regulator